MLIHNTIKVLPDNTLEILSNTKIFPINAKKALKKVMDNVKYKSQLIMRKLLLIMQKQYKEMIKILLDSAENVTG